MKTKLLFLIIVCVNCFLFFQLSAQTSYHLTTDSKVKISGTSTLSDWTVTGKTLRGELKFRSGNGKKTTESSAGDIVTAEVNVDVASIHSERGETMDDKIYKALRRDEYPVIRFVLRDPVHLEKPVEVATPIVANGEVSIAGVVKKISLDVDVSYESGKWIFAGKKVLKMSDFNIEPPTAMFGQIATGDEIEINVDLIFN